MVDFYMQALQNWNDFGGRARRSEYWYFTLGNIIISFLITFGIGAVSESLAGIVSVLFSLLLIVPGIAVSIRRLHDTGKSGWFLLIGLIPFVGGIILIVFFATEGTPGSNQYGPNPKGM